MEQISWWTIDRRDNLSDPFPCLRVETEGSSSLFLYFLALNGFIHSLRKITFFVSVFRKLNPFYQVLIRKSTNRQVIQPGDVPLVKFDSVHSWYVAIALLVPGVSGAMIVRLERSEGCCKSVILSYRKCLHFTLKHLQACSPSSSPSK